MKKTWQKALSGALLCTHLVAHASSYCDPARFLTLKADQKSLGVTEAQLEALPQQAITTSTHWSKKGTYRGPYLADVVSLSGLDQPKKLAIYTWDNFKVEIPYSDLAQYGVILATSFDGKRLKLDDFGPMFVVYPYDQFREMRRPAGLNKMAWQVCRIDVS
jgi:hypothetical protein